MTVIQGSSLNANNFKIVVTDGDDKFFEKMYYYGYNASWKREYATKDKPFEDDLIASTAAQYGVELKDVTYTKGMNVFTGKQIE
ncbi:MAG: hypothetical protein PHW55_11430 [Methanothrix sp.]|nr:hypothetical protein [Methanothrix sp.]